MAEGARTHIAVTTGTVTSATLLAQRLGPSWLGGGCCTASCRSMCRDGSARFLDHWRPDAAGFVESELWPNLLAACHGAADSDDADQRAAVRCGAWRDGERVPGLARQMLGGFSRVQAAQRS